MKRNLIFGLALLVVASISIGSHSTFKKSAEFANPDPRGLVAISK